MALLGSVPVWLWFVWLLLVFASAMVLTPRQPQAPGAALARALRGVALLLLGAALLLVRADTALLTTLLAALGGALYGNASRARRSGGSD